jgi:hypothetical protein
MLDPEVLRNRVTRIIAATRFPFVDQEEGWPSDYKTIVNDEQRRFGIKGPEGVVYPSIVILRGDGNVQELGMVERAEDVHEGRAALWRFLSDSTGVGRRYKKLFIYVPHGHEEEALRILEDGGIEYDGLRGYAVEDGSLRIMPIRTNDSPRDHR